jgi:membrane-bound lytic murein transglycosylase B
MPDKGSARPTPDTGTTLPRDLPPDAAEVMDVVKDTGPSGLTEDAGTTGTVLAPGAPLSIERRQTRRPHNRTVTISFPHPRTVMALLALKLARLAARLAAPPQRRSRPSAARRITGIVLGDNGLPRAATVSVTILAVLSLVLAGDQPTTVPDNRTTAADQGLQGQEILPGDSLDPEGTEGTPVDGSPSDQPFPTGFQQASPVMSTSLPMEAAATGLPTWQQTPSPAATPPTSPPARTTVIPPAAPSTPLPTTAKVGESSASQQLAVSGIPARARTSYTNAAAAMATLSPACSLPWSLLAAIGRVESNHGRVNRSALAASTGKASPAIFGILLNGRTAGTAVIKDSDRGALDGNSQFDRAVGPMQFLPGTWRAYALDADRDGRADPQDLDDAALTAGRFLCAGATSSSSLATPAGQWNAAFRYNRSANYANLVLALSTTYATGKPATVVNPPRGASTRPATITITATPVMPAVTTTTTALPAATPTSSPTTSQTGTPTTSPTGGPTTPDTSSQTTGNLITTNPSVVVTVTVSVTTVTVTGKR